MTNPKDIMDTDRDRDKHRDSGLHRASDIGRDDELSRLRERLLSRGAVALCPAPGLAAGGSGIGKTALALAYARRHADSYEAVIWVRAREPIAQLADYAAAATALRLPAAQDRRLTDGVLATRRWLEAHPSWLVVLDGAGAPAAHDSFLPPGRGHLLITSEAPGWEAHADVLALSPLTPEQAVRLLASARGGGAGVGGGGDGAGLGGSGDGAGLGGIGNGAGLGGIGDGAAWDPAEASAAEPLRELAAALGHLPRLLQQAGWLGAQTGETPAALLARLRAFAGSPGHSSLALALLVAVLDALTARHPASADLLRLCAVLSGEGLPLPLLNAALLRRAAAHDFEERADDRADDQAEARADAQAAARADAQAAARADDQAAARADARADAQADDADGLAATDPGAAELRRLADGLDKTGLDAALDTLVACGVGAPGRGGPADAVLYALRHYLDQTERTRWIGAGLRLLSVAFPDARGEAPEPFAPSVWPACDRLLPHALPALHEEVAVAADPRRVVLVAFKVGRYLRHRQAGDLAEMVYQQGYAAAHERLPLAHVARSHAARGLAALRREQGRLGDALALYQEALEGHIARHGADDPGLAEGLGLLGEVLCDLEQLPRAVTLFERAVALSLQGGAAVTDTLRVGLCANLGIALWRSGRLKDARGQLQAALDMIDGMETPPSFHIDVAMAQAQVLQRLGDLRRARVLLERILPAATSQYGQGSSVAGLCLLTLGQVLVAQGEPAPGGRLVSQGHGILRASLGPQHAMTLRAAATLERLRGGKPQRR